MKPILFNTDMVRAILEGRKTVTRRVVKPQLPENIVKICEVDPLGYMALQTSDQLLGGWQNRKCQYAPNDILYVRETWAPWSDLFGEFPQYIYRADYSEKALKMDNDSGEVGSDFPACVKWHPSIHMLREAARIFLRVTDVWVERLQDITAEQVLDEGVEVKFPEPKPGYISLAYTEMRLKPAARKQFSDLWNGTIKPADRALYGWDANPWVWVIKFERCEKPEGGST